MAEQTATVANLDELDAESIPEILPILPNPNYVLYPSMIAPMLVKGEANLQLVDEVVRGDRFLAVCAVRPSEQGEEEPVDVGFEQIYPTGTAAVILKLLKLPDDTVRLLVHGVARVRLTEPVAHAPFMRAAVEPLEVESVDDKETRASMKNALRLLKTFVEHGALSEDLLVAANNMDDPGKLADLVASNLSIPISEQQEILDLPDTRHRLHRVQEILTRELEIVTLGTRIQSQIKSKMDRTQREYMLREQLKAIRQELGEGEEGGSDTEELRKQIEEAGLPEYARKTAEKEVARLESIPMASPEYSVVHTYLNWILSIPWKKKTKDTIDLKRAQQILDEDHYDLDKIKERILEYLAVVKLRKKIKGPLLCLVGPPGTGKTSLGRSVARAMGRRFTRISLGGMRDEAEIRGHRRTYIGSMPGRIIKAMRDCETTNPVIMLDEIDKLGADFRGDPASALLEVLDPEQNATYSDHYLDMPYDLSNVMFITTANILDTIPSPLLDRMEVLRLSGYTLYDKMNIARQYLIPKALENSGLKKSAIEFTDEGLESLIEHYTREAGLRNLEREIANVCRKVARRIAEGKRRKVKATPKHIEEALGPWKFKREDALERAEKPGVAVGLAWTAAGGEILFIEANATPGDAQLTLTGKLGDIMKESAHAAITYLKSDGKAVGLTAKDFEKKNLHIHVPAGAIPKDGPSAGVAIMMAVASLLKDKPIRPGLAMTGEITLKGTVLPVGGIKEKVLAAHRGGIRRLILPEENARDLVDVPDEIKKELAFDFVKSADEALQLAFKMPAGDRRARKKSKPAKKTPRKRAARKKSAKKKKSARSSAGKAR